MRRGALFLAVVIALSSAPSFGATPVEPASTPTSGIGGIGPGYGGRGCYDSPARFLGVTTRRFPPGAGALAVSRTCNEEFPVSRLCEWADIFRALPPISLETDVLVAPNYESRPAPTCLTPDGGFNCSRATLMRPAACCGRLLPPPPPPSPASITLTPSDNQTVTTCADTFEFTATAYDDLGAPMPGVLLSFHFPPVVGGTLDLYGYFNPSAGVSDENGQVTTTLSFFTSTCEANCIGADKDCGTQIQAIYAGGIIQSAPVILIDAIP